MPRCAGPCAKATRVSKTQSADVVSVSRAGSPRGKRTRRSSRPSLRMESHPIPSRTRAQGMALPRMAGLRTPRSSWAGRIQATCRCSSAPRCGGPAALTAGASPCAGPAASRARPRGCLSRERRGGSTIHAPQMPTRSCAWWCGKIRRRRRRPRRRGSHGRSGWRARRESGRAGGCGARRCRRRCGRSRWPSRRSRSGWCAASCCALVQIAAHHQPAQHLTARPGSLIL